MKTVWVTGGRGFIGRHVAAEAARRGAWVAGIGHGAWQGDEAARWGVSLWHEASVTGTALDELVGRTGLPDVIYHAAGGASVGASFAAPREDFHRTVTATMELLDWLRQQASDIPLVVASSAAIYGARPDPLLREDMAPAPYSPYGCHKFLMEQLCRSAGANFGTRSVIVRLFSVYGNGLPKQLLWDLGNRMHQNRGVDEILLHGTGNELRDWTHVDDVARLLVFASTLASTEAPVLNGGGGIGLSVRAITDLFRKGWGADAPGIAFSGTGRAGDPPSLVSDPERLASYGFAWTMPAEMGILDYARWFRAQVEAS